MPYLAKPARKRPHPSNSTHTNSPPPNNFNACVSCWLDSERRSQFLNSMGIYRAFPHIYGMKSFLEWMSTQERGEEWLAAERQRLMGWTREELIDWLRWNDHNGSFTDEDAEAEGWAPLSVKGAVDIIMGHVEENFETPEEMMRSSAMSKRAF